MYMKLLILHGDDQVKLYDRLEKFIQTAKKRSWEIAYLDDVPSIKEALSASSLFGNERFFVLRDIKKLGKSEIEWLKKKAPELEGNLVIYHEGYIPVGITKGITTDVKNGHTAVIEEFKLPKIIFSLMDMIRPGNSTQVIKTLHKIVETEPVEFVFVLIAKLMRDLYWAKTDLSSMPYPSWRSSKLKNQADKFTINNLQLIISELSEIDVRVKTSKADLLSSLDLLIIKSLE